MIKKIKDYPNSVLNLDDPSLQEKLEELKWYTVLSCINIVQYDLTFYAFFYFNLKKIAWNSNYVPFIFAGL